MMVLVSGGTGFVGSHIVPALVKAGHRVRCLARRPENAGELKTPGVEFAPGDVTRPESLESAMQGVEAVVHLVAVIRERRGASFQDINVEGTRNMARAARNAGVKRFVHLSALGANPDPKYRYTCSKWLGEEAVRASGLDFVILRPPVIFGRGTGFTTQLIRSLTMFPFIAPVPGSGRALFQPVWAGDVAACVVKALEGGRSGETLEIGGPEHLSYDQVVDAIIEALGKRRTKVHVPLPLIRVAVKVMERVILDPPATSVELAQLEVNKTTDVDSIKRLFGFEPLPLRRGLDYLKDT